MTDADISTRDRLIIAAAQLFRQKGYHGTGLAQILSITGLPKGSLYHHFPNGKADLAQEAAHWASSGMLRVIDDAFSPATSYADGATTLCHKLAKFFDLSGKWDGCPVSTILTAGPGNEAFTDLSDAIFAEWIDRIASHARRLGLATSDAKYAAETLLIGIQGSWILARARRSSDLLRQLPARILDKLD